LLRSFFHNATPSTAFYPLSLHDALPISVDSIDIEALGAPRFFFRSGRDTLQMSGATVGNQFGQRTYIQQRAHVIDHRTGQPRALAALGTPLDLARIEADRAAHLMYRQAPFITLHRNHVLQSLAEVVAITIAHDPACRIQNLQI